MKKIIRDGYVTQLLESKSDVTFCNKKQEKIEFLVEKVNEELNEFFDEIINLEKNPSNDTELVLNEAGDVLLVLASLISLHSNINEFEAMEQILVESKYKSFKHGTFKSGAILDVE